MLSRVLLLVIVTLLYIAYIYYKEKDLKATFLYIAIFTVILSMLYSGTILTRVVLPVYILHLLLSLIAWVALIYSIYKRVHLWRLYFLPLVTIVLFVILNWIEGSMYMG